MSRLNDIIQNMRISDDRVLRKIADELQNNKQYYAQFETIDERIWAIYEKWVNGKVIGKNV